MPYNAPTNSTFERLLTSIGYRLNRVWKSPTEIIWMIQRGLPGIQYSSRRSILRTIDWQGSRCVKKVFRSYSYRQRRFAREVLARKVLADKNWIIPILESGDNWIVMPFHPPSCRLDRVLDRADHETKADIGDQLISILFDIHAAGYVHGDFHGRNMFWHDSRISVCDFEAFAPYRDGERPAFADCYDLTQDRRGIDRVSNRQLEYRAKHVYFLGTRLCATLGLDRDTVVARIRDRLSDQLVGQGPSARDNTRSAYGSFSLPSLSVPARLAQRDSARRLTELGVGEAEAHGASLLDLGCDVGSLLFEAQKFKPARCVGVEGDGAKIDLARQVAAFEGLNNVTFIDAADRTTMSEGLAHAFDLVFCRLWSSPVGIDELYPLLGRVTRGRLFIEGDTDTTLAELERRLQNQRFGAITNVGVADGRPLFVADKE